MALRESECLLVRRVADRGISKTICDSRVRGDQFNCDRRFAGRGNDDDERDPRDFKSKRLRRRVRDLELQHEIKQLKQRIRALETSTWKETEPERFVWDESTGDEEHPSNVDFIYDTPPVFDNYGDEENDVHQESERLEPRDEGGNGEHQPFNGDPSQLYEPIYQECLSEDESRFDEDGIELDKEECLFVYQVFNGITIEVGEHMEATCAIIDNFLSEARVVHDIAMEIVVDSDDDTMKTVDDLLDSVGLSEGRPSLEAHAKLPVFEVDSNNSSKNLFVSKSQIEEIILKDPFSKYKKINGNIGNMLNNNEPAIYRETAMTIPRMHEKIIWVLSITNNMKENSNRIHVWFIYRPVYIRQSDLKNKGRQWLQLKFDGQIKGFNYVFDPGGGFLKLPKLEVEFFLRGGV